MLSYSKYLLKLNNKSDFTIHDESQVTEVPVALDARTFMTMIANLSTIIFLSFKLLLAERLLLMLTTYTMFKC